MRRDEDSASSNDRTICQGEGNLPSGRDGANRADGLVESSDESHVGVCREKNNALVKRVRSGGKRNVKTHKT